VDTVEISMSLICTVKQNAMDRWVAGCVALDIFSQGKTEDEAKRCLEEAIGLWVEDCLERGTLDQALPGAGWAPGISRWERIEASVLPGRPGA
jgi:hypothetical protein